MRPDPGRPAEEGELASLTTMEWLAQIVDQLRADLAAGTWIVFSRPTEEQR
jgi:hypothetical protein